MNFYSKYEKYFILLLFLCVELPIFTQLIPRYQDTDNYTHAIRIIDLITSKQWAETPYMHTNYPFGEILHFTRITDICWIICSLFLFPFFTLKNAVFFGGISYQAIFLLGCLYAIVWSLKKFFSPFCRLLAVILFLVQPQVVDVFMLTRPDHHILTAFFSILTFGGIIRIINHEKKYIWRTALYAALGIWVSFEGLAIISLLSFCLASLWLLSYHPVSDLKNLFLYLTIFCLIFLTINPPYEGFFFPDNARFSWLFVVSFSFATISFYICEKTSPNNFFSKIFLLSNCSIFSFFILILCFSFNAVFACWFPPFIKLNWANFISELQPATSSSISLKLCLISPILSIIAFCLCIKKITLFERKIIIHAIFPTIIFTILSCLSVRYARLASPFLIYPIIIFIKKHFENIQLPKKFNYSKAFYSFLFFSILLILYNNFTTYKLIKMNIHTSISVITPYLSEKKEALLMENSFGPEAIWETGLPVISAPYHRNIEGIADNIYILEDENMNNVVFLLKKHRVSDIAIYMGSQNNPNILMFDWRERELFGLFNKKKDTLFPRLIRGIDVPCGFKQVKEIPFPWLIYHVDFSECSSDDFSIKPKN
ncbi:MAG: hypothetical protein MJ250_00770 [Alphaproteobacteria bacterium]|nr:hypothetical protein [Alphaproteobacteria bacterium]